MIIAALVFAAAVEVPVARIIDDAKAVDRVAAASKHDMPVDLFKRMLNEDIELLRGKRPDGSYEYASYEKLEAGRSSESFSVEANNDPEKLTTLEIKGPFVYRLVLESPSRRMLVTKNRPLMIDHVEIEYIPMLGGPAKKQSVPLKVTLEPGVIRNVDFDEIAKQATVRVFAKSDKASGYANVVLTLIRARISDNPDSPYADAVASAKAILRDLDHQDVASMRSMAQRMATSLGSKPGGVQAPASVVTVAETALPPDYLSELQAIEDLLTGNENERRQGLDRLHQLIRKLRPTGK
jgi:hypothetical protein